MSIVDVKQIVENKKVKLKREILDLRDKGIVPKLAVILANDSDASRVYVGRKRKLCHELGIEETEYLFDEKVTTEDLNMLKNGIIDPFKVSRIALEISASVASTLLTTECVVINKK